jgi:hypothetical protein
VHVTDSTDNQRPQADVQQDWDWGFDQDTLTDLETHWHDSSLDAGAEMNDGLRVLQQALQSAGAGGQPVFPSFHDILTAPAPAPSQQPQASLPPLSQPPRLLTLSQNDDASAMHAFPIHTPSKPPRVTDQLDPLWAGDLNMRAREEIESTRVAGCRKEMERKAKQRFVLYWFDAVSWFLGSRLWHLLNGYIGQCTCADAMGHALPILPSVPALR